MFKKTLRLFNSLVLPTSYEPKRAPEFAFSQSNIFRHACATPLTILISNLEQDLLNKKLSKNESSLSSSFEAAKRLSKIISSVAKKENPEEEFGVWKAINEVVCLLDVKVNSKYISKKILVDKDLFLFGNKLYFQEALSCVLNNAVEAYGEIGEKPINLIVREINNHLKIDIVDYGSGMNFVFQKLVLFSGITSKENGMGLGLPFAKKTIEKMFLGKMMIKSGVGFGTHVTWLIPLKKPYNQNLLQS